VAVGSQLCCRAMFDMITWAGFQKRYDALSHPNLRILEASHGSPHRVQWMASLFLTLSVRRTWAAVRTHAVEHECMLMPSASGCHHLPSKLCKILPCGCDPPLLCLSL
jgi:hypothetical protein